MDENLSILSLMKNDHDYIETLIENLSKSIDGSFDEMRKAFEKFEWKIEKHLFTEEKAVFIFYEPIDTSEGYKMLPVIMKQHNYILNEVNVMRKDISNGIAPDALENLKSFLEKHKNYEERELYPRLDESLSVDQKKIMIDRINEIQ